MSVAGHVSTPGPCRLDHPADPVVLLAALAAEHQRQQHSLPVAGDELLPLEREVPLGLGLQRRVDGIAATDELVQSEGERRDGRCPGSRWQR